MLSAYLVIAPIVIICDILFFIWIIRNVIDYSDDDDTDNENKDKK